VNLSLLLRFVCNMFKGRLVQDSANIDWAGGLNHDDSCKSNASIIFMFDLLQRNV